MADDAVAHELEDALTTAGVPLLAAATGAAAVFRSHIHAFGAVPADSEMRNLVRELADSAPECESSGIHARVAYQEAPGSKRHVLAVALDRAAGEYLLWFSAGQSAEDPNTNAAATPWDAADFALAGQVRLAILAETRRVALERVERLSEELRARRESHTAIGHELRNSVNLVAGWVTLLRSETLDAERRRIGLNVIDKNVGVQRKLLGDLLETTQLVAGPLLLERQSLDFLELVKEAIETILPDIVANALCLEAELEPELGTVRGDAQRLRQVLANLFGNAVKFTPPGGTLRVVARRRSGEVEFCLTDTGIGIGSDFLPRVFESFRQPVPEAARKGGFGLGLAIAKHLVELHGGRIVAESPGPGGGATFRIFLPCD